MIIEALIINQPLSGQYKEIIYNIENVWNSEEWCFVKFTDNEFTEWCGHFRGKAITVEISIKHQLILLLNTDYLFYLDLRKGDLISYENQTLYKNLIISPDESFLITDGYTIEKITDVIDQKKLIQSPIEMDMIEFKHWTNNNLEFTCYEIHSWKEYVMNYCNLTDVITIKNNT